MYYCLSLNSDTLSLLLYHFLLYDLERNTVNCIFHAYSDYLSYLRSLLYLYTLNNTATYSKLCKKVTDTAGKIILQLLHTL